MAATSTMSVRESRRKAFEGLRQVSYVVVGAGDATAEALGRALDGARDTARQLPERFRIWSEQAPATVETSVERLAERGRRRTETLTQRIGERLPSELPGERIAELGQDLESKTLGELQKLAAQREIGGRSNMNKNELIRALRGS